MALAELARKYVREGFQEDEVRRRLSFVEAKTMVVHMTSESALEAAKAYLELRRHASKAGLRTPSLADAIVYATAKMLGGSLVTGDALFQGLPAVTYLR
ncbi:hypothetical protein DRO57_05015 [Candidatus Bathyarchaeota archaeon]|nr:MAG: hypothetical protein DRO57_05015 [Candidatus Bathyarchaeota archaeon]